jgi:Flp pilus assembly protein protease CpaA
MRGLPGWMILVLIVLTAMLLYVGYDERHEVGWMPFILGVVFALFTLGAIGGKARGEDA